MQGMKHIAAVPFNCHATIIRYLPATFCILAAIALYKNTPSRSVLVAIPIFLFSIYLTSTSPSAWFCAFLESVSPN